MGDQAVSLGGDFALAQYRRGIKLERQGRIDGAIAAHRLAATLPPVAAEANSRLGHIFLGLGRGQEAADAFRAAATTTPDSAERRIDLVRALILETKDAEAEAEVRAALALDPKHYDGHWLLGRILTEGGRFSEAGAAFERSVALNPKQGVVYYDLVRSRTMTRADRPLIDQMLATARSLDGTDQRIRLHLALGKAFDDLQDYASAMRHFATANQIKRSLVPFNREAFSGRIDSLIERFTPDFLSTHRQQGDDSEVPIIVLGMPRSGTTLVEQIISSHGDVAGAGELQFWPARGLFFSQMARAASISDFQARAATDCLALLREFSPGAAHVIDKNPFNFFWAGLIHIVFPRAAIVHCRRSAIDTCLSIHSTYFAPRPDFSTDLDDLVFYYRQYSRLMKHWRAVLPSDRFLEVEYEALIADPESVSRRLISACGLAWDPACLRPESNARVVRSASKWQARQPINGASVGRWRRYEPWIGALRELVAED